MRIYHNIFVMKVRSNCDIMSVEFYSNCSSKKRPEKNCSAGFGDYCCIPECKSAFYIKRDGKRVKLALAYLSFRKITQKIEDG